jgi:hypothetical protein
MSTDLPSINCSQYKDGKCTHPAAPRRLLGLPQCILTYVHTTDLRIPAGCALKVERIKPAPPPKAP